MSSSRPPQSVNALLQHGIESLVFSSRWLQAPLYLGLIIAQLLYTYKFIVELFHILVQAQEMSEQLLLVAILGLIDVTMVANLFAMVIIGGYATFVSRIHLDRHIDKPDWLDHVDPGTIKIKLAGSLIGISSIHLLRSFVEIDKVDIERLKWQIYIHLAFVISTIFLALTEYFMAKKLSLNQNSHS